MNLRIAALTLCLATAIAPLASPAAEPAAGEKDLSTKETEVRRLKDELKARENELEQLRRENESLRKQQRNRPRTTPGTPAAAGSQAKEAPAIPEPSRPLANVPPPAPTETVPAEDLVAYFTSDTPVATAKFVGHEFTVHGTASRFTGALLQRKFVVELDSPSADLRVRAVISYPVEWTAVFPARNEASLVLRTERDVRTLYRQGDPLVFRARCTGVKDGEIRFDRGELVRPGH